MNKKLVALAVAGAFALPLAAQAQTANVTLYGSVRLAFENVRASSSVTGANVVSTNRVSSNSSRFGFKGEEDLGGGLKAIFQLETGVDWSANGNNSINVGGGGNTTANAAGTSVAGNAGNTIGSRDMYVGLTGGFGTVRLGQFDTPYKNIDALTARFLDTGIQAQTGLQSNCSGANSSFAALPCFDRRQINQVRYDTPNFAGFTAAIMYAIEQEAPGSSGNLKAQNWSGNLLWQAGPFKVGGAYEKHIDFRSAAAGPSVDDTGYKIAGNYTFGPINVGAVYESLKYDIATGGDLTRRYYMLTGAWTFGAAQLIGSWGKADSGKGSSAPGSTVGAITNGSQTGAKQWVLGGTYDLSKRTQLFTYYTKIDNDSNAQYRFSINSFATAGNGSSPSGFALGVHHHF
jgi:predicted porin